MRQLESMKFYEHPQAIAKLNRGDKLKVMLYLTDKNECLEENLLDWPGSIAR